MTNEEIIEQLWGSSHPDGLTGLEALGLLAQRLREAADMLVSGDCLQVLQAFMYVEKAASVGNALIGARLVANPELHEYLNAELDRRADALYK